MKKMLQELVQHTDGKLFDFAEVNEITGEEKKGSLKTFVVRLPRKTITLEICDRIKRNPSFVPEEANAYVVSEPNKDTQHMKENKQFSVYAIQFYKVPENQLV